MTIGRNAILEMNRKAYQASTNPLVPPHIQAMYRESLNRGVKALMSTDAAARIAARRTRPCPE